MTQLGDVPFQAHVELLQFFLARRDDIIERIKGLLNAQRKPIEYQQDGFLLSHHFEDCFFTLSRHPGPIAPARSIEEAHWASGFRPRAIAGLHNDLIDPAEIMTRAFYLWRQTRWPGRNGRVRYAHTLFNVRRPARAADDAPVGCRIERRRRSALTNSRRARPALKITPADQPVLVRDARWLIQLAQSFATDNWGPISKSRPKSQRPFWKRTGLIHKAAVRMTAGHLRSQIRYYSVKNAVPIDDQSLALTARNTNALDFGLLTDLVPLLGAYEHAARVTIVRRGSN